MLTISLTINLNYTSPKRKNCQLWCILRYIATQSNYASIVYSWTVSSYKFPLFFVFVFVFVYVFVSVNMCQEDVNIINFPQLYDRLDFWP